MYTKFDVANVAIAYELIHRRFAIRYIEFLYIAQVAKAHHDSSDKGDRMMQSIHSIYLYARTGLYYYIQAHNINSVLLFYFQLQIQIIYDLRDENH